MISSRLIAEGSFELKVLLYEAVVMAVAVVKTEPTAGSEGSFSFSSSHLQNSRSLSDTLAAEFQRCLADQTFVDVRLYGGLAESVRCHKVVLAAFSGVLAAALADAEDAASDDETAVIIPDMSLDDLTSVVEFVYYRSLTLQAGDAGGMPRRSLVEWLTELGICGEEELERALGALRDQEQQHQKIFEGDVVEAETENKLAVIPNPCDVNARPFECDFGDACNKRFPSRHRLNLHRKQAHGVQPPRAELSCSGKPPS